ncbi:hypothetical protein [Mesorhizobium sp. IMUNJ 23232]|uniref:hypothetical protein n=1 Tax=Mesorhizobium sp. IMUNJ 23232 TaxID=3376064 RepID=UPI00379098B3
MIELDFADYTILRELTDDTGMRKIVILRRRDGNYCFAEMLFWPSAPEDEGYEIGWAGEMLSGIYGTQEEAETEARRSAPWLRVLTQS